MAGYGYSNYDDDYSTDVQNGAVVSNENSVASDKSYASQDYGYGGGGGGGGYHSSGYGHVRHECCPLVVDPLTVAALLSFIAGGAAFLNVQITMILGRKRRKRGTVGSFLDEINLGEK